MARKKARNTRVRGESEKLIGYCGLYCGDCSGYKGTLANMAQDLNRELERERFGELAGILSKVPFFKAFEHYPQCCEVLQTLSKLRCKKTCRGGGGPPRCGIRECNRENGLDGCWQCGEFKTCPELDFLKAGHGDAHLKNLARIKRNGTRAFLHGKRLWRTKAKNI
ncbi:MAG: DUF3795 domain-containing protein [Phycisphaerales bacterium]